MDRTVTKHGSSLHVSIPAMWSQEWGVQAGDECEVVRGAEPGTMILKFKRK